jgi:hypothetical protein
LPARGRISACKDHVLSLVDDTWLGSDDFSGSQAVYRQAVDAMAPYSNAKIWPMGPLQFLWDLPDRAAVALKKQATLIYLDGTREHVILRELLAQSWPLLRPGGMMVVNGYRTGRMRNETYPLVDSFFRDRTDWEPVFDNRQFGCRKCLMV